MALFNPDKAIADLIEVYRAAYLEILQVIATKTAAGRSTVYEKALLADVNRILLNLDSAAREWASTVIPKVYKDSAETVYEAWLTAGLTPPTVAAGFAKVHEAAIRVLAENAYDNLHDANLFVGRRIRDQWRRASLQAVLEKQTTGKTVRETKKILQTTIADEGLGAFKDKAGRIWRPDVYAGMVARTTTAEATNLGMTNQLQGMGYDLVMMSEHSPTCGICAPYQGRVYSITGATEGYPSLKEVPGFSGGYSSIHPNCRHRISPYIAELDKFADATKTKSNRSFDVDPRSQAQQRAYERSQERNRLRRERRKLEEQFAVLPPGPERDALREKLRQTRSKQISLGKEERQYLDEAM